MAQIVFRCFIVQVFCFFLVFGCIKEEEHNIINQKSTAIFVYMAADNDLDFYAISNINQLEAAFFENNKLGSVYVYLDRLQGRTPSHPCLLKITADSTPKITSQILRVYPEQNSCSEEVFEESLEYVKSICEQNNEYLKGLILWSHGSGWVPTIDLLDSYRNEEIKSIRSFGIDFTANKSEMDIVKLADKLKSHHFEFLIFDACFMSSIEVLYELKNSFDYIIASPTEILANGFPYQQTIVHLFKSKIPYDSICNDFVKFFEEKTGILKSASIAVIKTDQLPSLANRFKYVVETKNIVLSSQPCYNMKGV